MRQLGIAILILCALMGSAQAQQGPKAKAEKGIKVVTLSIVGDREQPKVLYIVPWKRAPRDEVLMNPTGALDTILRPVDPEVLAHEVDYDAHLRRIQQ